MVGGLEVGVWVSNVWFNNVLLARINFSTLCYNIQYINYVTPNAVCMQR